MADQLASPSDLASLLQQDLDASTADLVLDAATAVVQATVGQRLVEVVDDELVLDLDGHDDGGVWLLLPERPVTAVSAVLVGDTAITDYTVQLRRARLWREYGWRSAAGECVTGPSTVTVTYTHGWPDGHQRLELARAVTLSLARTLYANPSGAARESIDDYQVAYEAATAALTPHMSTALKRQYGRQPGSVQLLAAR